MGIDTVTVGSSVREVQVLGDPVQASVYQNYGPVQGDSRNLGTQNGAIVTSVPVLINPSTNLGDEQRAAPGTLGVPSVNTEGTKPTYAGGIIGFTPAATPNDIFQIVGSSSKTVRVTRISISGIASSGASVDLQLIKRTTANTGGTTAAVTPLAPYDSNDSAATATVNSYSANPTLGASAGVVRAAKLNLGATGAAGQLIWDFTTRNSKGLVLRGTAQSLNINWNGAAVPSGTSLAIDIEFSEE